MTPDAVPPESTAKAAGQAPPAPVAGVAELQAAVRAVESGERPADSFFARPEPAPPARPPAPPGAAGRAGPDGDAQTAAERAPVVVPEGVPELLAEGGAPASLSVAVAELLGEGAVAALRADPWRLLSVPGVRPAQADSFARALLGPACGPGDPRRVRALTVWLLGQAAHAGHTAMELAAVVDGLAGHAVPDPEPALRGAVEAGVVLPFREVVRPSVAADATGGGVGGPPHGEEPAARLLLGLDRYALAEESLADGLHRLRGTFSVPEAAEARGWEEAAGAAPSPSAAELIRAAGRHGLVVHTGGEAAHAEPVALVAAARALGLRAYAVAHGPDSRRRLRALLPAADAEAAVTVTGLLAGGDGPARGPDGQWGVDLLAVLGAEQLGAEAAASLVESLPDGARLVLSGDLRLLGSAGPGQVLADVLAAGVRPHLASRTPDPGPLGDLVSGVGAGELTAVEALGKEIVIVPVGDAGEAVHRTVQLVTDSIPRAFGESVEQVQVITAAHGGPAGTRALNAALKERLNPGPGRFGGFDPGDRVAHAHAPGQTQVATVAEADSDGLWLVGSEGRFPVARQRVTGTLRHGWALTAHQAAGARWPAAVVVIPPDAIGALDRAWVATAFSRAERHLSVVQGAGPALTRAVAERPATPRTTRLRTLLREQALATDTS